MPAIYKSSTITAVIICSLALTSCTKPEPVEAPVYLTPNSAKVNLSQISMTASNVRITKSGQGQHIVHFDYTILNQSDRSLAFNCLYNRTDKLIEVNLSDAEGQPIPLEYNNLDSLTLAKPKPLTIRTGETTSSYKKLISPSPLETGSLINVRIRLHTPSRYDELRSSLEAPLTQVLWP